MGLKEQLDELDHWPLMERILGAEIKQRKMYRSPLREGDKNPSFGFFRNKSGQARWKDFAMDNGDVYHLAMNMYRCDFRTALKKVAQIAGILPGEPGAVRPIKLRLVKLFEAERAVCSFEERPFATEDEQYWGRYLLSEDQLKHSGFIAANSFTLTNAEGKTTVYHHRPENPMYVIRIGTKGHMKMYRPLHTSKKFRFLGNTDRNDIYGYDRVHPDKPLLITGGQKDAETEFVHLGVPAIAFNSESSVPDEDVVFKLFMLVSRPIFVLYDNDDAGRAYTERVCSKYNMLTPIYLSQYSQQKDFSAVIEKRELHVIDQLRSFINKHTEACSQTSHPC